MRLLTWARDRIIAAIVASITRDENWRIKHLRDFCYSMSRDVDGLRQEIIDMAGPLHQSSGLSLAKLNARINACESRINQALSSCKTLAEATDKHLRVHVAAINNQADRIVAIEQRLSELETKFAIRTELLSAPSQN